MTDIIRFSEFTDKQWGQLATVFVMGVIAVIDGGTFLSALGWGSAVITMILFFASQNAHKETLDKYGDLVED